MNKNIAFVWMITLIIIIWQASALYNELPDKMATSFDGSGDIREYSSKNSFYFAWIFGIVLINSFVYWSRLVFKYVPVSMINVPNREYWLATPERREEVAAKMTNMFAVIFSFTNVMMILIFEYIAEVNIKGVPSFPFYIPMMFIPVLIILPLVWMFRVFQIPQEKT